MPRSRSTSSGRRSSSKRGKTRKTPARKAKRKTASKEHSEAQETSSSSDTSPFKGYLSSFQEGDENVKQVRLFDDVSDEEDRHNVFDNLLDPPFRSNFLNKNIRTYSNKKKLKPQSPLLEFQDSKNREKIIHWLNDNHNLFDKLTQTQCDNLNNQENEVPLTLDMPSVSQVNSAKMNRSHNKTVRKTHRSPYKLRARSLDIHITKNGRRGRNKRHSLAGDTPSMENYHIEEIVTDDETPVPAERDAKLLLDLMEDEYLDTVEKEILLNSKKQDPKTHQNNDGWERIKDISKTINNVKKQPKQLNITLQSSQNKKDDDLLRNRTCDLEILENYFIEKMASLLNNQEFGSPGSTQPTQQTKNSNKSPLQSAVKTANNLVGILQKFINKQNNLNELQPLMSEIKNMLSVFNINNKTTCEAASQTVIIHNFDKQVQTNLEVVDSETQTKDLYDCSNCANNNNVIKCKTAAICDKIVQTEVNKNSIEVQTETISNNNSQGCMNPLLTSGSTTPSDIFLINEMEKLISVNENNHNTSKHAEIMRKTMTPNKTLNHTLDNVYFDTEEMIQEVEQVKGKSIKDITHENKVMSIESVLVRSTEVENPNKGVKRTLLHSPVNDAQELRTKRPCTKFIKDDLTVAFDSCVAAEEDIARNEIVLLSEESDDDKFDEHLDRVMRKCNDSVRNNTSIGSASIISKTQKDIEDLEEKIRNAAKPARLAVQDNNSEESNDSDVIFIRAEMNLSKLEKDLDYFNLHSPDANVEKTPKKSRKKLFDCQEDKQKESSKFSESLFNNTHENLVIADDIANRTITKDNVDMIMKNVNHHGDIENDNEVKNIMCPEVRKINVLQNVIVGKWDDEARVEKQTKEDIDDIVLSGIDVVECTPQKKVPSFVEHRSESFLDITLPPPLEFQDVEMKEENRAENIPKAEPIPMRKPSPLRRPLAVINKITSTPMSQRPESEKVTLSPISLDARIPGPIEIVQQSKFSPLTIIKTTQSQRNVRLSGTPKQKSILNYVRPSQESQENTATPSTPKNKPCVSCSRISRDQVISISGLSNKKLISYSSTFSRKVTHMIVSVNNQNRIKDHTIKSVSAIAAGIWVLSFGWVQECLAKNTLVPEEPYEVLDVSGIPGPRKSRLTRSTNPLLKGYKIYVSPPFLSTSMQDIENIVQMLGGKVAPSPEDLLDKDGYICLIITEGKATQDCDSEKFETWLEALRVVTVDLEWLSRSVGQYQLQSLLPFTLCSDDLIDTLGYPPELLTNVPVSFMQTTSSI